MRTQSPKQTIAVVIPTRDRPEQLMITLDALTRQTVTDFGVVVVDDGSRRKAEAAVPAALRDALRVRFVRNEESLGAGAARNRGVAETDAGCVIFIDDDCIAGPQLVQRHHEALSAGDEPVVSLGPILPVAGRRLPVWLHWDAYQLEREYSKLASGQTAPGWEHLFTGNVGLRRADFLAIGGFDERFSRGEDTDLGYRLAMHGCRFEFDSAAYVEHASQRRMRSWINIASAAALSDIEMHQRVPESDRLAMVAAQLDSRHRGTRLARRLLGGAVTGRCAIVAAMGAGLVLHAVRADRLAFAALSVVRDLAYWRALQEALPQAAVEFRPTRIEVSA